MERMKTKKKDFGDVRTLGDDDHDDDDDDDRGMN